MVPRQPEQGRSDAVRLLRFCSSGERFSLEVSYVREIIPLPEITPVPFVPPTVAGIVNHRGTIYTLISFARLAGLRDEAAQSLVLLRLPDMSVGITVGQIDGIELPPGDLFQVTTEGAPPLQVPFLRRTSDGRGHLVHVIDAESFIDAIYQLPELARAGAP